MKIFFLFLSLSMFNCFGQDISEINKNLELAQTLGFEKEIRIYKDYSIKDRIEILLTRNLQV